MSADFVAPKGIPDYYPPASADFRRVRDTFTDAARRAGYGHIELPIFEDTGLFASCLLYTSPSPRDLSTSRMPSSA